MLLDHLRRAFATSEGTAAGLALIRRGAIYACVTLRADMISGLPLRLYRVDAPGAGRSVRGARVDLSDPRTRYGMPRSVGGKRLAEYGSATAVESSPVLDLLRRPNDDWSGRMLMRQTETGLCLVGEAHWQLHRGDTGTAKPSAISWVKHDRLGVIKPGDPQAPEAGRSARTVAGWHLDRHTRGAEILTPGEVLWLRYPDPDSPDYGALAPAAVASAGADAYHHALGTNRRLFQHGLMASGAFVPPEEMGSFEWDQLDEMSRDVGALLMGAQNAHKAPVLPYRFDFRPFNVTPRDAEFVALMEFAIEDVARAYRIPIEMVGGTRRTYQNNEVADVALWQRSLEPEACWIAEEMTARLLPAFGLDPSAYYLAFDFGDVVALQADEDSQWAREKEQLDAGVLLANEWREAQGREAFTTVKSLNVGQVTALVTVAQAVGTGMINPDTGKAIINYGLGLGPDIAAEIIGSGAVDVDDTEPDSEGPPTSAPGADTPTPPAAQSAVPSTPREPAARFPAYGSEDHARLMRAEDDAQAPHIARFQAETRRLFRAQRQSILDKLGTADTERAARFGLSDLVAVFDRARWIRAFREMAMREYGGPVAAAGDAVYDGLGADGAFNPAAPEVIRQLRARSQRFAVEVNATTWDALKRSFEEGIAGGETPAMLAARVDSVMGTAIRSRATTIARTETHAVYQAGSLEAARQTGLTLEKTWLSALDSRVRDDHVSAHGQTVGIDEDFTVGGTRGPGPGNMGDAAQDVNCRCTTTYARARRSIESIGVEQNANPASL